MKRFTFSELLSRLREGANRAVQGPMPGPCQRVPSGLLRRSRQRPCLRSVSLSAANPWKPVSCLSTTPIHNLFSYLANHMLGLPTSVIWTATTTSPVNVLQDTRDEGVTSARPDTLETPPRLEITASQVGFLRPSFLTYLLFLTFSPR